MKITDCLASWALEALPDHATLDAPLTLTPITGDAGFRCYYRLNTRPTLMAVHAPPSHEDVPGFVSKDLAFKAGGVGVPTVYAVDYQQGFMLQSDLGHQLLQPVLNQGNMERLYGVAERELVRIQCVKPDAGVFPPYDSPQLQREMALFPEWFVGGLLDLQLDADERQLLQESFTLLTDAALSQPQVVVHRDYHSRNLLLSKQEEIGVIDFQDALVGAFTYDLVSLLKDCYIRWPAAIVRVRALAFLQARVRDMGAPEVPDDQLLRWFDFMGLQRHIKVLGIFARLWLRDGKPRYLDDLPLVLRYTLEVTAAYGELKSLDDWLTARILPELPKQSWYRDWHTAGE